MTETIELIALPLQPGGTVIVKGVPIHMQADGTVMVPKDTPTLTREQLILDEKDADTATKRIYYALQLMTLDSASAATYHGKLISLLDDRAEATELQPVLRSLAIISELSRKGEYLAALEVCRHLIQFDDALVREFPAG
ncbi:flagellar biosynthesis repressor FlbT [Skermanella pratensis]|uniref:flagellar biosynthesis repressor FlbT n=1 Tax=Skermanella pratensis TaxID=2233999 RepID=UPI00130199D3|nr:flagellar biosynthesis repressor FlbT [Skermanella pratensis]